MDVEVNISYDGIIVEIFLNASFSTDYLTGVDKSQFLCIASDQSHTCKSATPSGCPTGTWIPTLSVPQTSSSFLALPYGPKSN